MRTPGDPRNLAGIKRYEKKEAKQSYLSSWSSYFKGTLLSCRTETCLCFCSFHHRADTSKPLSCHPGVSWILHCGGGQPSLLPHPGNSLASKLLRLTAANSSQPLMLWWNTGTSQPRPLLTQKSDQEPALQLCVFRMGVSGCAHSVFSLCFYSLSRETVADYSW